MFFTFFKNLGVKTVDGFRKAYIRLGQMLCEKVFELFTFILYIYMYLWNKQTLGIFA